MSQLTLEQVAEQNRAAKQLPSVIVFSSIVQLATDVVKNVSDSDVSGAMDGEGLTRQVVSNFIANRIKQKLN